MKVHWKKGEFQWMGEMWTPLLGVCKCAEKAILTLDQLCAFWWICLCRLQEGESIFYWERVTEIYQPAYHPTITAICSVLLARSLASATQQKHPTTFVPKRPDVLTITQLIQDVFQLICTHLGLASRKAGIYRTFSIGWKQSQPPCCRRTAFFFSFATHFVQLFLASWDKKLAVRRKKKFLVLQEGAFLSDKLPVFFYHCLKLSEAV